MGRPKKLTMDFFIHDANASCDRKIRLLTKKHGNDGYATYFRFLECLCQESGMQISVSDTETAELLAEDFHLRDVQHLYSILQYCADIKLFDKQLWESERLVFSPALHWRYSDRLEERKNAAQRKRRSREAKALQDKIDTLNAQVVTRDNGVTIELSQNSHRPEDQNSEDQNSEPYFCVGVEEAEPKIKLDEKMPSGYSNPQKYVHPAQRLEEQFRSQGGRNYPWREGRNLLPGFAAYVGNSLPNTGDDSMPPAAKGSRYIRNRENEHDFEAIEAYLEAFKSGRAEKNTEELQREVVRSLQAANLPVRIPEGVPGAIAGGIIRNLTADQCELVLQRLRQVAS